MADIDDAQALLASNAAWAEKFNQENPNFFHNSASKYQTPHTLWIGCSDSRVPESVITDSPPGAIFVHRNIANQVHLDDNNILSVLRFAVLSLRVKHVVVVGHSECGGASACLNAANTGPSFSSGAISTIPALPAQHALNRWLEPLTRLVGALKISAVPKEQALPTVVEANVKAQVANLINSDTIREAWGLIGSEKHPVTVHGWVYELAEGKLRDLKISQGPPN